MKVLVATSDVPFVEGGHRMIARALVEALREAGHESELFTTPQNRFGRQFSAYLATRITDVEKTGLGENIDRLISIRFPSYALKHPSHVCWLNHRMREYYDLWSEWTTRLSLKGRIKESIRRSLIHTADGYFLKNNVRKVFVQSHTIQADLLKWGNIKSEVLFPPPPSKSYYTESYGDFILSPSRLTPLKRVPLLIEALSRTSSGQVVIVGEGAELTRIQTMIREKSLEQRVTLLGQVPAEKLLELYATCRAVYYAPAREDYGLVTLEAFHSRKPVLTATDSGGPTELVRNGINGFVTLPEPESLSACMATLFEDSPLAQKLGMAGYEEWKRITWPETVARLLAT